MTGRTASLVGALSLALGACASTQLTYNTVDVASSVERLQTQEALANLSKFIDNPMAIPAQVDLVAGSVQTSTSVSPSLSFPLSDALARGATGALTGYTTAAAGATVGASNGWQQSWTTAPVTDGNLLRNLRAIYRYAVVPEADLRAEYYPALVAKDDGFVPDAYLLRRPHCVLCISDADAKRDAKDPKKYLRLFPNPQLPKAGWLYWTSDPTATTAPRPYDGEGPAVDLGHYGNHRLFVSSADYRRGVLSDFTLFVFGINSEPLSGAAAEKGPTRGTSGGGNSRLPGLRKFDLSIDPSVKPQIR